MSASDPNVACREFLTANIPGAATHWHHDMRSQAQNQACSRHQYASCCIAAPVQPDLAVCGTPCHPYSTQRADRFKPNSVASHHEYDVAMKDFMIWLRNLKPRALIFEQVDGFMMPIDKNTSQTPYDRCEQFCEGSREQCLGASCAASGFTR